MPLIIKSSEENRKIHEKIKAIQISIDILENEKQKLIYKLNYEKIT